MKIKFLALILLIFFFFSSCSLIYLTEIDEDEASEMTLYDLVLTKVSDGKIEHRIEAKQMEQYRKDSHVFAHDVQFTLFDKDEKIETEGWAGNLKSEKEELLYFSDGVEITSYKEDTRVSAKTLRVDTQLEQLTSAKDDIISIEYGIGDKKNSKLSIFANTIAASGVSNTIRISGRVYGSISIDDAIQDETSAEQNTEKDGDED